MGFKLFVGVLAPDYVTSVMHADTYNKYLINLYIKVQNAMLTEIGVQRDACRALGYHGPFLGGQVDLTTVAGEEYITFSESYIPPSEEKIRRVGLATRAFHEWEQVYMYTYVPLMCFLLFIFIYSLFVFGFPFLTHSTWECYCFISSS